MDIVYSLGWLGTGLYLGGTMAMAWRSLRKPANRAAAQAATTILLVGLAELFFDNALIGVTGVFLLLPLGLVVAYKLAALGQGRQRGQEPPVGAVAGIA